MSAPIYVFYLYLGYRGCPKYVQTKHIFKNHIRRLNFETKHIFGFLMERVKFLKPLGLLQAPSERGARGA